MCSNATLRHGASAEKVEHEKRSLEEMRTVRVVGVSVLLTDTEQVRGIRPAIIQRLLTRVVLIQWGPQLWIWTWTSLARQPAERMSHRDLTRL